MKDLVLSVPVQDAAFIETLAQRNLKEPAGIPILTYNELLNKLNSQKTMTG